MRFYAILLLIITTSSCTNRPVKQPAPTTPTSPDFLKGEAFFNANTRKDSAFYYFTRVTEVSKDSLLVAMAYSYIAMIQQDAADFFGSEESALEGLRYVNEKNPDHFYCISSIYNELGASNLGLKNYDAAIDYYELAIQYQQDDNYKIVARNNIAVAYREKGDYRKAIGLLESNMDKQKVKNSGYARILTNLASLKWKLDPSFNPIPQLQEALQIRLKENNDFGATSSYDHLSNYYLTHKPDSALFYATKMYEFANRSNSADNKIDALRKLIRLSAGPDSKLYFKQYEYLNDSIQSARNAAKNQYALIKYQSEKSKAENLVLQKDNSEKELKIFRQNVWITSIVVCLLAVILFFLWWLRKERKQMKLKAQVAIQEANLETSQRVHDVVANGLYRIMSELEYNGEIEKEQLLDKIDQLYERSRDISYEPVGGSHGMGHMSERVNNIVTSFATPALTVSLVGNHDKVWDALPQDCYNELEHVFQELIVNMKKHSQAHHVVLRFTLSENEVVINYRDDGKGFGNDFRYGNGLKSTENRIGKIGGNIIFAIESSGGASIKIVIPIRKS